MVIGPSNGGASALVILSDGEFLPANLNSERILVYRRGISTGWELKVVKPVGMLASEDLLRPVAKANCTGQKGDDPLHQHDDKSWWFFDEEFSLENGPFETYDEAYGALAEYCLGLTKAQDVAAEILSEIKDGTYGTSTASDEKAGLDSDGTVDGRYSYPEAAE